MATVGSGGSAPRPPAKSVPKPAAKPLSNAGQVFNTLRAKGYSAAAAAGVVGNLQQESGVNPGSKQAGGAGRGIAQWGTGPGSGGRWEAENAYASAHKSDPWALGTQVDFLLQEMNQRGLGATSSFGRSTNISAATQTFETKVEQAGNVQEGNRVRYAQSAYGSFAGNPVTNVPLTGKGHATPAAGQSVLGQIGDNLVPDGLGGWIKNIPDNITPDHMPSVPNPLSGMEALGKVGTTLFTVSFWIRAAFIIAGLALVLIGTKALLSGSAPTMSAGGSSPMPTPQKAPKESFGSKVKAGAGDAAVVAA